jgi:hypothetical protein
VCTVTIVGLAGGGFRLADNRDERDTRPAARPPRPAVFGSRRAILPIDPQGGGTWVAVNDAGLALAILNVNPGAGPAPTGRLSRGRIIPSLLHCADAGEAAGEAARIHPTSHAPFRLVLTDGNQVAEAVSDGARLRLDRGPLPAGRPVLFTSSSLGDAMVQEPRRALFEEMFARAGDPVAIQDAFHAHLRPDRREVSVLMRRPGARTVSRTVITVRDGAALLEYLPIPATGGAAGGRSVERRLPLRRPRPEVA